MISGIALRRPSHGLPSAAFQYTHPHLDMMSFATAGPTGLTNERLPNESIVASLASVGHGVPLLSVAFDPEPLDPEDVFPEPEFELDPEFEFVPEPEFVPVFNVGFVFCCEGGLEPPLPPPHPDIDNTTPAIRTTTRVAIIRHAFIFYSSAKRTNFMEKITNILRIVNIQTEQSFSSAQDANAETRQSVVYLDYGHHTIFGAVLGMVYGDHRHHISHRR